MSSRINKIGLEVLSHDTFVTIERFVVEEIANGVEDRSVEDRMPRLHQRHSDALGDMAFFQRRVVLQVARLDVCGRSRRLPDCKPASA